MAYRDKDVAVRHVAEYNKANYDRVSFTIPKGQRAVIKAVATRKGVSLNAYIVTAIRAQMERDSGD